MALKQLFQILNPSQKKKFIWLFCAILIMGTLEVIGVASILPFMELLSKPDAIQQSSLLTKIYEGGGFVSEKSMFITFGVCIILLIGLTNAFSIYTLWMQYTYSWATAHQFSMRLLFAYIQKPYKYFLTTNTSELQTYIVAEVTTLITGIIIPMIELISRSMVSIFIFSLLLMIDIKISLVMFGGLGGAYLIIYLMRQGYLKGVGKYRIKMNVGRFKALAELFGGVKTVMIYGKSDFFVKRFEHASKEFCQVQPKYNMILSSPKYVLEFLAFGSILLVTIYMFYGNNDIQSSLPRLSLYAVAGYRLLPALQKAFAAAAKMKHNLPILDKLTKELRLLGGQERTSTPAVDKMPFQEQIELNDISFSYSDEQEKLITHLNINIKKGSTVAFVGSTGSGKTTIVDLIVGLHTPASGQILVDGYPITDSNRPSWQKNIAYVPQDVFLFDDTVRNNIALGDNIPSDELLKSATHDADIYDFIVNELIDGFDTEIGERGVRLSGGQRQRLGLARALYHKPSLLVLDEATSALDAATEKGIIDSLLKLPQDTTTIIIAHRLSTVRHADCIYVLQDGAIKASGTYEDLISTDDIFREMVELS